MAWLCILCVTFLAAGMVRHTTIERTPASVSTVKNAIPLFIHCLSILNGVCTSALQRNTLLSAHDIFLNLSTIASRRYSNRARTTSTFVTLGTVRITVKMFATRHHFVTHLTTAPSTVVVRFRASLRHFVLPAETNLDWPQVIAWRTRTSMARQLTGVWAFPRSLLPASLPTRVRWNTRWRSRLGFFLTPASISFR